MSVSLDEAGLAHWGRALGEAAARDAVFVALYGPLGAGKTRLAQAACAGAGVAEAVTSPTYTLVHWYEGDRGRIAHVDLYRIEDLAELRAIGWEELESGSFPVFVEWADRAWTELPGDRWDVRLQPEGDDLRRVTVERLGDAPPPPQPTAAATDSSSC